MKFYIARFHLGGPPDVSTKSPAADPVYITYAVDLEDGRYAIGTDAEMRFVVDSIPPPNEEIEEALVSFIRKREIELFELNGDELVPATDRIALDLLTLVPNADSNTIFVTREYKPITATIEHANILTPVSSGTLTGDPDIHWYILNIPDKLPATKIQSAYNLLRAIRAVHDAGVLHGHLDAIYNGQLDARAAELDLQQANHHRDDVVGMLTALFGESTGDAAAKISKNNFMRVYNAAGFYDVAGVLSKSMPDYWHVLEKECQDHALAILNGTEKTRPIDFVLEKFESKYRS